MLSPRHGRWCVHRDDGYVGADRRPRPTLGRIPHRLQNLSEAGSHPPQIADKPRRFAAGFCFFGPRDGDCLGWSGPAVWLGGSGGLEGVVSGDREGDFLHILGGCREPALIGGPGAPSAARVTVPVPLLGISKRCLHRLTVPLVDVLAP